MSTWTVGKPVEGRLRIAMPFDTMTRRKFLDLGIRPVWAPRIGGGGRWLVSRDRMPEVLHLLYQQHGPGTVIIRGHVSDRCDIRCQRARGHDCVCSCAGRHHGLFNESSWLAVGETTLVRGGEFTEQRYTYDEGRSP